MCTSHYWNRPCGTNVKRNRGYQYNEHTNNLKSMIIGILPPLIINLVVVFFFIDSEYIQFLILSNWFLFPLIFFYSYKYFSKKILNL